MPKWGTEVSGVCVGGAAQRDAGEKAEMVRETADDCSEESMMCVFRGKQQQRLLFPHRAQL